MKRKLWLLLIIIILLLVAVGCNDQQVVNQDSKIDYQLINSKRAYNTVIELSSEKYNGRLVGTLGHELAKEYIKSRYEEIGLEKIIETNSYYQTFEQIVVIQHSPTIIQGINNNKVIKSFNPYIDFRDLIRYPGTMSKGDFQGKLMRIETFNQISDQRDNFNNKILIVDNDVLKGMNYTRIILEIMRADERPKAILIHNDDRKSGMYLKSTYTPIDLINRGFDNENGPAIFFTSNEMYSDLLNYHDQGYELKISLDYSRERVTGSNIIGKLIGTSDNPKNIIIGAHYDHVGNNFDGSYNPGALDNASGVSAMLEIASVLKDSEGSLKNNYIFVAFDGEEELLNGSNYYVNNPTVSLESSVMINLDMVGSSSNVPLEINDYEKSHGQIKEQFIQVAKDMEIEYKSTRGYMSDNQIFESEGIPSVLLINYDDQIIHRRFDTADQVNDKRLAEVIELVLKWIEIAME